MGSKVNYSPRPRKSTADSSYELVLSALARDEWNGQLHALSVLNRTEDAHDTRSQFGRVGEHKNCDSARNRTPTQSTLLLQLSLSKDCPEDLEKKGKAIPLQAWTGPEGSRNLRLPRFQHNWHMKVVRLSALRTGHLYPQGNISATHFC